MHGAINESQSTEPHLATVLERHFLEYCDKIDPFRYSGIKYVGLRSQSRGRSAWRLKVDTSSTLSRGRNSEITLRRTYIHNICSLYHVVETPCSFIIHSLQMFKNNKTNFLLQFPTNALDYKL
jgi:hypothetical protein